MPLPGFCLRTLTIAVAVAGFVAAGSWWGLAEGEARAERERCGNNLRQLTLALCAYHHWNGTFPAGTLKSESLPPEKRISWIPLIHTWTDYFQGVVRFLFDTDRPWDCEENRLPRIEVQGTNDSESEIIRFEKAPRMPLLECPSNRKVVAPGMPNPTSYVGIAGLGRDAVTLPPGHPRAGVFGYDRQTRAADITDGASTTLLLAETTFANASWTAGGPATVRGLDPRCQPYLGRGRQFGGAHRGGAMVAFADGSVRFLRVTIDPKVFEALSTITGREPLPTGWDR